MKGLSFFYSKKIETGTVFNGFDATLKNLQHYFYFANSVYFLWKI